MIARRVENASVDRFGVNAGVGKKGFDWVLAGERDEGSGESGDDMAGEAS